MRNHWALLGSLLIAVTACGGGHAAGTGTAGVTDASRPASATRSTVARPAGQRDAPVQLAVDPCALVTQPEAETAVGAKLRKGLNTDHTVCTYGGAGDSGRVAVVLQSPDFCKLLILALDENLFGSVQVRRDDVGDGGMQVLGHGNVQFLSHDGCVEVEGSTATGHIADPTILEMAKVAASRVTG